MKFCGKEVTIVNNNVYDCSGHCLGAHYYSEEHDMHYVLGRDNKGPLEYD